ncbi:hypothetical protein J7554_09455 [Wohlfahrtiimonas chitiniclastica]|uniref:CopG family transcriptional regulator n=1 Tax=Wohlfahrtiimonas chitiniclastica TaxID=400946 RepID=A0AB35C0I1_9GAMM|nr:DUF6290 family protein [Wohlfahrtiimonas chitiniclastica]KZX37301.1 hypothetical protein A6V30_10045 [Wohlfahrtiimonas chitiniclastica]MBS7825521.1 hypothetical protein [Wohlfahrtiimonas chitiniclastica]MBS7829349.1 hypothetical protein [Wohlfahrtiimonas chitiniclastica]MBS7841137.1 hypothetical protein [Wohlfahrtiimonas chitiniclastica]
MSIVSIRLNDHEANLFKEYAEFHGASLSSLFKASLLEKMEDELDIKLLEEAIIYNKKHPETYTHDEVRKVLGL